MSVRRLPDGRYLVRFRDALGVHRGRTFPKGKLTEARQYERDRIWERDFGDSLAPAPRLLLAQVGMEFRDKVIASKEPKTQTLYKWLWNRLIVDYLGDQPINRITVGEIEDWLSELETGPEAKRKAASLLSQVFKFAMKHGYCQANPAQLADRPKREAKQPPFCPTPEMIEGIRRKMLSEGRHRDATFVSILAYAGLRPGEARILTWDDWTNDALIVRAPKTADWRAVKILAPLAQDLTEWKERSTSDFVIPNKSGKLWTAAAYNSWEKRCWRDRFAPPGVTPYSLRHAACSLYLRDPAYNRVEVARMLGHSLAVQDATYAHVALAGQGSAVDAIWDARRAVSEREEVV